MSAGEMFKSLGYAKKEKSESIAFYVNEYGDTISFQETKHVVITPIQGCRTIIMTCLLENAIHKQCEELGWIEKEEKTETNYEHFKNKIIEDCCFTLALVDGKPQKCSSVNCNGCGFSTGHGCREKIREWLKSPYEKPTCKLTKFEYDLLNAHKDSGMRKCISNYGTLLEMYGKGHFKSIDTSTPIHEILDNCKVV